MGIVVTSFGRPASLARLVASIERDAPAGTRTIVVHARCDGPPWVGALRRAGTLAVPDADPLLFLDDDHELRPGFAEGIQCAARRLMTGRPRVGLVSLPLRAGTRWRRARGPVALAGGMLVARRAYEAVGGHGDDYLEDLELALRLLWGGWAIVRCPERLTTHHGGLAGGLRAVAAVHPKRTAHERLSRLEERYPGRLVRDPRSWWGYRLTDSWGRSA
jgi:hypothetical protein